MPKRALERWPCTKGRKSRPKITLKKVEIGLMRRESASENPSCRRGTGFTPGPDLKIKKSDFFGFLSFPFLLDCLEKDMGQRTNT